VACDRRGLVGYVSLALAFLAAGVSFDPADGGRFGLLAGVLGTCVVVGMHLVLRSVRLTGWGLSVALIAVTGSAAAVAGVDREATGWVLLAQAAVAALAGGLLVRRSREAAAAAFRTALILAYMAAVAGGADVGYGHLSGWLLVISLSVVATFVLAVSLGFDGMIWIGVAGSLVWLAMAAAAIGSSAGWAFALVLVGSGLVALSLLVNALRSRRMTIG
jgi:hypothetical protein